MQLSVHHIPAEIPPEEHAQRQTIPAAALHQLPCQQTTVTHITASPSLPENAAAVGRLLKKCSNTEICVIPHIDRDPALKPDPFPLVHIKQQHRFDYEKGLCYSAELSEGAMKKLFSFQLR